MFDDGLITAFLETLRKAPKNSITYDQVPGNLGKDTFQELSHYCHRLGYIDRTGGTLDGRTVMAVLTARGRQFLAERKRSV